MTQHRSLGAAERCKLCQSIKTKNANRASLTGRQMVHERTNWDWIA